MWTTTIHRVVTSLAAPERILNVSYLRRIRMRWVGRTVGIAGLLVFMFTSFGSADLVAPGKVAPEFASGAWINSEALTLQGLRGRVVLVDFWTYG